MTLTTLADVRELIEQHLPVETRKKPTWQHVARCIDKAGRGGDSAHVVAALQLVLSMEGVECRPQ